MSIKRRIELILDRAAARRAERQTQDSLKRGTDPRKAQQNIGLIRRAFDSMAGSVGRLGATLAGMFALRRIRDFAAATLSAFGRQERAILRVNSALLNMGRFTEENAEALQDHAAAIQRITSAGDEAILEATATIADLATTLTVGELAQAQEAAVALADTFFDGNLNQAAKLLAKSLGSSNNALARYGVEIDTAGTASDKLLQILKITEPLFRTSQRAALDLTGQTAQLSNSWGDLQEAIGGIITRGLGLNDTLVTLRVLVDRITESLEGNQDRIVQWGAVVMPTIRAAWQTATFAFRALFNLGQVTAHGLELVMLEFQRFFGPSINMAIEVLNALPGVDIQFRMNELTPEGFRAEQERIFRDIDKNAMDLADTVFALGDSYRELGQAAFAAATGTAPAVPTGTVDVSTGPIPLAASVEMVNASVLQALALIPDYSAELQAAGQATEVLALTTGAAADETDRLAAAQSKLRGGLGFLSSIAGLAGFAVPGLGQISGALTAFSFGRQLFAGGFQHGGTIPAGRFGVVGERGPELVTGPATVSPSFEGMLNVSMPAPSNPLAWQRDQEWLRGLGQSIRNLKAQGHQT